MILVDWSFGAAGALGAADGGGGVACGRCSCGGRCAGPGAGRPGCGGAGGGVAVRASVAFGSAAAGVPLRGSCGGCGRGCCAGPGCGAAGGIWAGRAGACGAGGACDAGWLPRGSGYLPVPGRDGAGGRACPAGGRDGDSGGGVQSARRSDGGPLRDWRLRAGACGGPGWLPFCCGPGCCPFCPWCGAPSCCCPFCWYPSGWGSCCGDPCCGAPGCIPCCGPADRRGGASGGCAPFCGGPAGACEPFRANSPDGVSGGREPFRDPEGCEGCTGGAERDRLPPPPSDCSGSAALRCEPVPALGALPCLLSRSRTRVPPVPSSPNARRLRPACGLSPSSAAPAGSGLWCPCWPCRGSCGTCVPSPPSSSSVSSLVLGVSGRPPEAVSPNAAEIVRPIARTDDSGRQFLHNKCTKQQLP